jgi:hypothetical protein
MTIKTGQDAPNTKLKTKRFSIHISHYQYCNVSYVKGLSVLSCLKTIETIKYENKQFYSVTLLANAFS